MVNTTSLAILFILEKIPLTLFSQLIALNWNALYHDRLVSQLKSLVVVVLGSIGLAHLPLTRLSSCNIICYFKNSKG